MKKIITICAAILMTASVFAQSPDKMSYQAVIRNSGDTLVANTAVGMRISILQGFASGTAVYVETQTPTSNANGLVSIEIGAGTVGSGDFATIDWANGPYFIKTETDPSGGANYTITGTSQLLSVPYALHAKTAENISGSITETDPVFSSSIASSITGTDTTNWNNKLDSYTETDPVFSSSIAAGITGSDTTNWNNKLDSYTETDPVFSSSIASSITGTDTANWNNKLDSYTETDPVFSSSIASGITGTDTINWNNKLDSYTETDPIFSSSIASGITGTDTTNWNNKLDSYTETDPIFGASIASGITSADTANWNKHTDSVDIAQMGYVAGIKTYEVGDFAQGGVVFWVDETKQHGLVCAIQDVAAGTVRWYAGTYGYIRAKGDGVYSGKSNTHLMLAGHMVLGDDGGNYAASVCSDLVVNQGGVEYGDWYLPSVRELYLLGQNYVFVNNTSTANGGTALVTSPYWSSVELNDNDAIYVLITPGGVSDTFINKAATFNVRAVRAF